MEPSVKSKAILLLIMLIHNAVSLPPIYEGNWVMRWIVLIKVLLSAYVMASPFLRKR